MSDTHPRTDELSTTPTSGADGGVQHIADDASPTDVFEHLARIRSGISDGVITPW